MGVPRTLVLRDLAVLSATACAWVLDAQLSDGAARTGAAVVAGGLTALCGYLFHEWGHYAAARWAGARVVPARGAGSLFLFRFDCEAGDRRQFLAMSAGGFVASAVAVVLLLALLPLDTLSGRIALGLVALGVLATLVLEVPVAWRVARGAPLPRGAAYASVD